MLLTTHYMDEAERLCNRVAIVNAGQVIALGTPRELIASLGGEHVIEFALATEGRLAIEGFLPRRLPRLPRRAAPARKEVNHYSLSVAEPHVALPALLGWLTERNLALANLTTRHASLEDVFVHLAGRHINDGDAS